MITRRLQEWWGDKCHLLPERPGKGFDELYMVAGLNEEIQDTHKFTCVRKDFKPVPGGMSKVCDLSCRLGN